MTNSKLDAAFNELTSTLEKEYAAKKRKENRKEFFKMLAGSFAVGIAIGAVVVAIDHAKNPEDYDQD